MSIVSSKPVAQRFSSHLKTPNSHWFWIVVGLTLCSSIVAFVFQADGSQAYVRYVVVSFFILFVPGYALFRALFPPKPLTPGKPKGMDAITRVAFSVVLSIATVSVLGLILDYTWGVSLITLIAGLIILTMIFSGVALFREWRTFMAVK